jgi:hypothetical protein
MSETAGLRKLDYMIWALIATAAAIVMVSTVVGNFIIAWATFAPPAGAVLALTAAAWLYRRWRPDPRLAAGLENTAQIVAFTAVGAPLSYIAAAANLPLQDHVIAAADRAIGFDWRALLDWMNAMQVVYAALHVIYLSLTLQMTTAALCLAFTGRLVRLRVYLLSFIFAALITIAISALLPAVGAWPYYALSAADSPHLTPTVSTSWPVFYGLRDGSIRALIAVGAQGIISFPSLHAGLAVILVMALWPVPVLRWVMLALNLMLLAATPIDGSHYLSDVLAGITLAALCFFAAGKIAARFIQPRQALAPTLAVPALVPGE